MKEFTLLCWNVNGIRAARRNGFLEWLYREAPDILCVQETKADPALLDEELRNPKGYHSCWNFPQRKGYGGVATFSREQPRKIQKDISLDTFDTEGRIILAEYNQFVLFNVYFPNGKKDETRLKYKMDFYNAFFDFIEPLRKSGERLILCGDFNTAHKEIDLSRPKENSRISGFLPMERAWLDKLVAHRYIDTFRHFNQDPNQYTWWDMKTRARERNVGWRLDYFFITENLLPSLTSAFIMREVTGSDHCPVGIKLAPPR
jgi:exodeoxyribonuclease-3